MVGKARNEEALDRNKNDRCGEHRNKPPFPVELIRFGNKEQTDYYWMS